MVPDRLTTTSGSRSPAPSAQSLLIPFSSHTPLSIYVQSKTICFFLLLQLNTAHVPTNPPPPPNNQESIASQPALVRNAARAREGQVSGERGVGGWQGGCCTWC